MTPELLFASVFPKCSAALCAHVRLFRPDNARSNATFPAIFRVRATVGKRWKRALWFVGTRSSGGHRVGTVASALSARCRSAPANCQRSNQPTFLRLDGNSCLQPSPFTQRSNPFASNALIHRVRSSVILSECLCSACRRRILTGYVPPDVTFRTFIGEKKLLFSGKMLAWAPSSHNRVLDRHARPKPLPHITSAAIYNPLVIPYRPLNK